VRADVYCLRAAASKAQDISAAALTGAGEILAVLTDAQFTAAHEMLFDDAPCGMQTFNRHCSVSVRQSIQRGLYLL
jgi:alpha-D-ribose 1-methylphosphonate 5-phosphate C-P lyase